MVSLEELRQLVYLQDGELYWAPRGVKNWDSRYAHTPALTHKGPLGRRSGVINGRRYLRSRVVWALTFGSWPEGNLDHKDRDPSNDCVSNLRVCSQQENMFNRTPSAGKTSAFKGVSWHKHTKKWRSYIEVGGKKHSLGYFHEEVEAAKAYNNRAAELFGEFAFLNTIGD